MLLKVLVSRAIEPRGIGGLCVHVSLAQKPEDDVVVLNPSKRGTRGATHHDWEMLPDPNILKKIIILYLLLRNIPETSQCFFM